MVSGLATTAVSSLASVGANEDLVTEYLVTEEVATLLRTTPETVRWWRHTSKGPKSFKVGRRVLYAREDIDRFIAEARGVTA